MALVEQGTIYKEVNTWWITWFLENQGECRLSESNVKEMKQGVDTFTLPH